MSRSIIPDPLAPAAIAQRCKRLRRALGYDVATDFCHAVGISPSRWCNIESGRVPLSHRLALLIHRRFLEVDFNYIYFGRRDGLPVSLAEKIRKMEERDGN